MSKTTTGKKTGVWLDHDKAHFIDLSKGPASIETAYSNAEHELREKGEHGDGAKLGHNRATNNEFGKHNRANDIAEAYYKMLAGRLQNYDGILLFGPGTAKDELYNRLSADKHFDLKEIYVEPAGHLTENQMVARVKKVFNIPR